MIKVKINNDGVDEFITLLEYLIRYHQTAPEGWFNYIDGCVSDGMSITNANEYEAYLRRLNLKWFDYERVNKLYRSLKRSRYNDMLDDDVLKYISHIYGLGCFERINYKMDIQNPNLDILLNTKNIFQSHSVRNQLSIDEKYSLMDLLPLKNGMNAIRKELLLSSKW